jgi:hypothetical protein
MSPEEKREKRREAVRRWRERNRPEGSKRRAPTTPWTDAEDAVLIASEALTMQQISDRLDGRSKAAVQTRIQVLRKNGLIPRRNNGWKGSRNPFHCPRSGILLARTCIRCGEFQPAGSYSRMYEHGRSSSRCHQCRILDQLDRRIPPQLYKHPPMEVLTADQRAARIERRKEGRREANRRYHAAHSESLREKYWRNREANIVRGRAQYRENREEICQRNREQWRTDPVLRQRAFVIACAYREKHREYLSRQDRKKYQKRAAIPGDNNRPWTDIDDATVLREDITIVEMVYLTGRTYPAVMGRRGRLLRGEMKHPLRHRHPRTKTGRQAIPAPHNGERWTSAEDAILAREDITTTDKCHLLGRSYGAVCARRQTLRRKSNHGN